MSAFHFFYFFSHAYFELSGGVGITTADDDTAFLLDTSVLDSVALDKGVDSVLGETIGML